AHVLGKLLVALGPRNILWGTDSTWYGSPQPLIDAFRAFTIPEPLQEQFGYPALTPEVKEMILGDNARRVYRVADEVPVPAVADDWVGRAAAELVRAVSAAG
ncbi:MAG: amidohydrolase family protein, partial [Acidimicrobiales bacterium]